MMTRNLLRTSTTALFLALGLPTLAAQTIVNVPCARDNTLYEDLAGLTSNGSGPSVFCGKTGTGDIRRTLLYFDVAASVPAGARVLAARLKLNVAQSVAFLPITTDGHRVLQNWGEGPSVATGGGGGGGTLAQAPDATWLHAQYPTVFWTNPGGDYSTIKSFSFPLPALGPVTTAPLPGLVADVQDMLDNPATNFGWLLRTAETFSSTARRLDSRESTTPAWRPTLEVTYLQNGQSGTYGVGCPVGAGTYQLNWSGVPTGGTTIQLLHQNAPTPSIGANFFSLGLDPIGTALLPGCTVYLPLTQEIIPGDAFVTSGGFAISNFNVPAGYPGFVVNCQGATLDANLLGFSLSNAALIMLQ